MKHVRSQPAHRHINSAPMLTCPSCNRPNFIAAADLIDGAEFECPHCPAQLRLVQDFDPELGRGHWQLEDAAALGDDAVEER